MDKTEETFLERALEKARQSINEGGFPAGTVVVKNGKVISEGVSVGNIIHDPTSHSDMACIRDACRNMQSFDLSGAVLYASMQPCVMCMSAAMWAGIAKVVFACSQAKVSAEYYGGHYDVFAINKSFLRPMDIEHLSSLEESSLAIVHEWEKKQADSV